MDFDAAAAEAYAKPFPVSVDIEAITARNIVKRALVVGPIIIAGAWLLTDSVGAVSAMLGVVIVVANFLLAGWLLSQAATVSMQTYHIAALFGFVLRMGFVALSMFAIAWVFEVDRPAMGIAAIVAFLALLVLEAVAMLRGARKDLEWS
ncbi:MAG: hypothetical protein R2823_05685 [Acidimicrobiia bacterium]